MAAILLMLNGTGWFLLWLIVSASRLPSPPLRTLELPVPDTTALTAPERLERMLVREGVPYARLFVRIAIAETGWRFGEGVGAYGNPFGMQWRPTADSCVQGRDGCYSAYRTRERAVQDLKRWCDEGPPRTLAMHPWAWPRNLPWHINAWIGTKWLQQRGWNPNPDYWLFITSIPY